MPLALRVVTRIQDQDDQAFGGLANGDLVKWNGSAFINATQASLTGIAHANLTGLTSSDDHTQYALLAGRSAGQTLVGGTGSGENLTLSSTVHATKGKLLFGSSAYDQVNTRLGIGNASPTYALDVSNGDLNLGTSGNAVRFAGNVFCKNNASTLEFGADSTWSELKVENATRITFRRPSDNAASISVSCLMLGRERDAGTTTTPTILALGHESTGTPAAGFGGALILQGKSSTTSDQNIGSIVWSWIIATHASRTGRVVVNAIDNAGTREGIRIDSDGSAALLGFFGATAVVKQTSGANLTNNVTSGGTDDTITNWTDLTTYATDAAAIRNAVYQLARKLKQVNDSLRSYGLLT